MTSTAEIAWAAGFLEGEGHFRRASGRGGCCVQAGQVNREPLERLSRLFGGSISGPHKNTRNGRPIYKWSVCGATSRGLAFTIFALLSPVRRAQVTRMISSWRDGPNKGYKLRAA